MKKVLIIGAASAIAVETTRLYAADGAALYLAARNKEKLDAVCADMQVRGASAVYSDTIDFNNFSEHEAFYKRVLEKLGAPDVVLIAHGGGSPTEVSATTVSAALEDINTNFSSAVSLLIIITNEMVKRASGTVAVITSVAGDRGRKSNYPYGAAKGALSLYLGGMRNRLAGSGVNILTIKPGFVDTPMTAPLKKGPLFASAETVGKGIYKAIERKADVVYLPWFWRYIMFIITHIPEKIFKRLSI